MFYTLYVYRVLQTLSVPFEVVSGPEFRHLFFVTAIEEERRMIIPHAAPDGLVQERPLFHDVELTRLIGAGGFGRVFEALWSRALCLRRVLHRVFRLHS